MALSKKTDTKTSKLLGTLICIFKKSEVEITFDGSAFQIKALDYSLSMKKWQMLQALAQNKSSNIQFNLKGENAEISVILKTSLLKKKVTDFLAEEKLLEEESKSPRQKLAKAIKRFVQKN